MLRSRKFNFFMFNRVSSDTRTPEANNKAIMARSLSLLKLSSIT